jgi:hypothetical protein
MRKPLLVCALVAWSVFTSSGRADAGAIPLAGLAGILPAHAELQLVDWHPYRHCHGTRWHRWCHGYRRHWRHRHVYPGWRHHYRHHHRWR